MEKVCFVGYTELLSKLGTTIDTVLRRCLSWMSEKTLGVTSDSLYHICYVDLSKLGRVSQQQINDCMVFAKSTLERNPAKSMLILIPPLLPSAHCLGLRGESRPLCL